jgi:Amt family ammonium transporter
MDQTSPPSIDTGNTAFMIICMAMVNLMTPGLAFFYGGLVRRKNVLVKTKHMKKNV